MGEIEQLVRRAKKRDPDAFTELMQLHERDMYRTASAILSQDADIADAMQETILTCWEKIDTLQKNRYFKTWMIRILINKCKDILRLGRRMVCVEELPEQAAQESPAGRRVRSFPRAAGILLAVVILSATAVSAAAVGIVGYRRYMAERMTDIGTEELGHLEMVAEQGNVTAEFSRELTARERSIYEQLTREYEADGKYPAGQIRELAEDEDYSGTGVAVRSTPGEEYGCLIYLPDTTVTEEEWLEVIEYVHKLDYSIQEKIWQQKYSEVSYFDRYEQMSDAEIDELYAMLSSAPVDVWGGDSRDLTPEEQTRYEEWTEKYEQENAYTETTIAVITFPEEYDGQELVYCIADAQFYYPERSLTDEELLQLIDLEHKNLYIYERIQREIERGERAGWPETYDIQR